MTTTKPREDKMKRALTLYYDNESMELAEVVVEPVFESETYLGKADVLRDCLEAVGELYDRAAKEHLDGVVRLHESQQ